MKLAYLGPEGSFSHIAATQWREEFLQHSHNIHVPEQSQRASLSLVPTETITSVFEALTTDHCSLGLVPIENSIEGVVTETLDNLIRFDGSIQEELIIHVELALLTQPRLEKNAITTVLSHPQPLAQTRQYRAKNLPNATATEVSSTSLAARMVAENHAPLAAIAHPFLAQLYPKLHILDTHIQDNPANYTRFSLISKHKTSPPATNHDKTSLIFSTQHEAGKLYAVIGEFAKRNISLTSIQSRPTKQDAWEYMFFVECEGHRQDPDLKEALVAVQSHCNFFNILGSYPRFKKEPSC